MRGDEDVRAEGQDVGGEGELVRQARASGRGASPERARVLVIEAVAELGQRLGEGLGRAGFAARVCADARTGLQAFLFDLPDLIVTRAQAADPEGRAVLRDIRAISDVPVVLVGDAGAESVRDRVLAGSVDADEVARLASAIVAAVEGGSRRTDETGWTTGDVASLERTSGPRRITAAQVRSIARSELEAELERLLVDCRGNLAEMARRMGKDRSTIRYHLRRFGMLAEDRSPRPEQAAHAAGEASRPPA
ncbi:MAG: hypothetical protein IPK00_09665 [Deltaproteobacteria bacterium]|nr:hypothetical protein [Deltaproteobacteria bacterium]